MTFRSTTKRLNPSTALMGISIVLPALLFGLAAWQSYRTALREADARVERTARILQEHAVKVFETHRLVLDLVNGRLRFMTWDSDADRLDLHAILERVEKDLDQVATITITDAEGRLRATSRPGTPDPTINFADRDWFQALKQADVKPPFVSRSYIGRQSGHSIFNVAERVVGPVPGAFDGAVAVSVDRAYFESFYKAVEPAYEHAVSLVRDDGEILAREPPTETTRVPPQAMVVQMGRRSEEGTVLVRSSIDGIERLAAFRRVGNYPVFVTFAIGIHSLLAPWRQDIVGYGLVAALASAVLLAVSMLAIRRAARERAATARWQDTATQLRAEVAQRERAEEQSRQSQKMEAVGRLTGGVAHDFNNLLTVVIGSLDLLKRRLGSDGTPHVRLADSALEGARRAATLTHRLLAFSRQQPLAPKPVDANALVSGLSDLLRRTLGEAYEFETVLSGDLWPTLADPHQLESALVNLAVNARDAMPDGGKLTVETANAHLDAAFAAARSDVTPGPYVMIGVSDTGSGMPPDVVRKAFEPFFTTKPAGKGTGLGLSQVYGFVRQSGGHCAISSQIGHGTTLRLYLPRLSGPAELPAAAVAETVAVEPRGETVLIVEDEMLVRQFSASVLKEAGYTVLEATDGARALAILQLSRDAAMLFTDVVLTGGMNGRELADAAQRMRPDLVVLFTTGYTRDAVVHHGRLDEGTNLISKPFTADALVRTVAALLAERTRPKAFAEDERQPAPGA